MELGIAGRKAIVCASSKGLGRACARALAEAGCAVVLNGRDKEALNRTASELRQATDVEIREVLGDLDSPETRAALIGACPDADILVNNNGGPPYKSFSEIGREDILKGVESNMLTPIALVQALAPGMAERKFGRIINITSSSVRTPVAGLDVSSGARAGLTAFLASAARMFARDNVTINSIQPGSFETDRQKSGLARAAAQRSVSVDVARTDLKARIPVGTIRRSGGIRRALRLPRKRSCGIYHRAEHPHRRRRLRGIFLSRRMHAARSSRMPIRVLSMLLAACGSFPAPLLASAKELSAAGPERASSITFDCTGQTSDGRGVSAVRERRRGEIHRLGDLWRGRDRRAGRSGDKRGP